MNFAIFNLEGFLFFLRWMHFFFGIIWIGHLYYFNFTQTPFFAETDAGVKSGVIQKLVPRALWWFRWGAMFTLLTGLTIIAIRSAQNPSIMSSPWGVGLTTGTLLGLTMWANVWFVIWPAQKVVIASATQAAQGKPAIPEAAARAARAGIASRTNVLFSIPLLFFMGTGHLPFMVTATSLMPYYIALLVVVGLIELNALKGKMGPMATVKGVIHMGLALTVVMYFMMEFLTK